MSGTIVSICDFGAERNHELQTVKIQNAIDYCFNQGGGEVQVPEGVFLTGGIRLRSNVTLHLLKNAVLKGSKNPEDYFGYLNDKTEPLATELVTDAPWKRTEYDEVKDYRFMRIPGSRWNNALIRAINAENIAIIGDEGAVLDGSDCYDELGEEYYRGPHCINLFYCKNIRLQGYTIKDSANWATAAFYCDNITADGITVLAGHDGIHITVCNNVKITDCKFYTGDDCVAGFANTNVLVKGCELNSACNAMRFGGTNVFVEKCHIYGPCKYLFRGSLSVEEKKNGIKPSVEGHRNNMLSVFTYYSDFSVDIEHRPGNIVISDCAIEIADRFLYYNYSGSEIWQQNRPLDSITFENINATGIIMPFVAYGDAENKVTVRLKNAKVGFRDKSAKYCFMHACNYDRISFNNVAVENYGGDSLITVWSKGKIECENVKCGIHEDKLVKDADFTFKTSLRL